MKTWKIFSALFLSCAAIVTHAQNTCASDDKNDQLLLTNAQFARSYMYMEQAIAAQMALNPADRTDDIYVIPVVVHIVHEGEAVGTGSNISDDQIFSAITALNEDFRHMAGTNGDGAGVDIGIEFCLAQRDPDGQPATGIVRVDGSVIPLYADQGIEATGGTGAVEEDVKELSTWPRQEYMNIWIVNEIEDNNALGGIQGYAYFPINNPIDGIVVLHNAFGTVGNLKLNTDMNRTLTHEAGHFFGLYHTFHLTDDCDPELNCSTAGDKVCDTPVTPLNGSCNNPQCSDTQQVENYMDYTPETCKNMFGEGQKVRMRTTLENDRAGLLTSLGCESVSDFDCGISYINSPTGSSCNAVLTPDVSLTNFGSNALTSCTIHYNLDGTGNNTYNWTGNLATGTSVNVSLPNITSSAGAHLFFAWTALPNGVTDQNVSNDQESGSYSITSGSTAVLLVELDNYGTENTWEITDVDGVIVAEGGPYVNFQQGLDIEENICIPAGCYTLTFFDSYGDGQGFTSGDFTLFDSEDYQLVYEEDNWGEEVSNDFCLEEIISDGEAPTANFSIADNTICPNGEVDFNDTSINAPVSWSWTFEGGSPATSSQQNPQNISFGSVGSFDVTLVATNAYGTSTYVCMNCVTVNTLPFVTLTETHPACYAGNNGNIVTTISGNSPFTFSWNSGQSTQNISNLVAGSYTLTSTDANGCIRIKTKSLTNPVDITATASITQVTCNGLADGFIYSQGAGGTGALNYAWSNGSTSQQLNNLPPGNYTVTISDANSCTEQQGYTITQPAALTTNLTDFDIACEDVSGSASVNPSGGTSPYTVEWSNGSTGNSVNNLGIGNYSVTLSDAHDCSNETSFIITQSESLSVFATVEAISCAGSGDGSASVNVFGGTGNYSYQWSNGFSSPSINNLGAGNYSVEVEDTEGCSGDYSFSLSEPSAVSLAVFKTDISCHDLSDGTASATALGGTGILSYAWSNGTLNSYVAALAEGTYMVTASDQNGCDENETITIVEPSQLVATCELVSGESCAGSDGAATVNIMGGTPGYVAQWSNGVVGMSVSDLSAGDYDVGVADGNGCTTTQSIVIPFDCEVVLPTTQLIDVECNVEGFDLDGGIFCVAVPGAQMYHWKITNTSGDLMDEVLSLQNYIGFSMINGLTWGVTAFVTIKVQYDGMWGPFGNSCLIGIADEIPTPQIVQEDCGVTGINLGYVLTCNAVADAQLYDWHITGPDYDWTPFTFVNELELISGMLLEPFTTYNLQVRVRVGFIWGEWSDACSFALSELVGVPEANDDTSLLDIYPNPSDGQKIILDFGNLPESGNVKDLEIFGSSGSLIETINLSEMPQGMRSEYKFKHPLPSGIYFIRYTLSGKTSEEKLVVR
ncbi:MAG: M43 family zinc metalloprotease [Flavobacteriales bacterium]|nr:M43 family zinc metalloprotease [Flavobacteriales bacterium]